MQFLITKFTKQKIRQFCSNEMKWLLSVCLQLFSITTSTTTIFGHFKYCFVQKKKRRVGKSFIFPLARISFIYCSRIVVIMVFEFAYHYCSRKLYLSLTRTKRVSGNKLLVFDSAKSRFVSLRCCCSTWSTLYEEKLSTKIKRNREAINIQSDSSFDCQIYNI